MLVTFKTSAYSNITMFGDVAKNLLRMMGQSGNVPGALMAEDVSSALQTLRSALDDGSHEETPQPLNDGDDHSPAPVALKVRAKPLIDLLEAAIKDQESVVWDS